MSPGARIHKTRAPAAAIFYLVRGGVFYFLSPFFSVLFTMLKQMQSHFVRTCEVSNYAAQISAVSHPNIRLPSNEHL